MLSSGAKPSSTPVLDLEREDVDVSPLIVYRDEGRGDRDLFCNEDRCAFSLLFLSVNFFSSSDDVEVIILPFFRGISVFSLLLLLLCEEEKDREILEAPLFLLSFFPRCSEEVDGDDAEREEEEGEEKEGEEDEDEKEEEKRRECPPRSPGKGVRL